MKRQVSVTIDGVVHRATVIAKAGRAYRVVINATGEQHCVPKNRMSGRRPNRGKGVAQ